MCRGTIIGLMIDGARMVTPNVINLALKAYKAFDKALVSVPGYHLGTEHHYNFTDHDKHLEKEITLLKDIHWQQNGYALFNQACFSEGNRRGYFHPFMESTLLFSRADEFHEIGGADERFSLLGGGSLNLHIYRSLGMRADSQLIVLPGEGNFHQYHGGVTTSHSINREKLLTEFRDMIDKIWGGKFKSLTNEPCLLGSIGTEARSFLTLSCENGLNRFNRLHKNNQSSWQDSDSQGTYHGN